MKPEKIEMPINKPLPDVLQQECILSFRQGAELGHQHRDVPSPGSGRKAAAGQTSGPSRQGPARTPREAWWRSRLEKHRGAQETIAIPPVARASGGADAKSPSCRIKTTRSSSRRV
jgi:hypothetical protein